MCALSLSFRRVHGGEGRLSETAGDGGNIILVPCLCTVTVECLAKEERGEEVYCMCSTTDKDN